MREIKFRGWHTTNKVMFSAETMATDQLTLQPTGEFINVSGISTSLSTIFPRDKFIPLQYTGLKDKNGKEIYEGDIVECEYYPSLPTTKNIDLIWRGRVVWNEFDASFHVFRPNVEHCSCYAINYSGSAIKRWEVIGNIYENSELLKEGN